MSKFYASVVLISMLLVQTPSFAADSESDTTKTATPSTTPADKNGGAAGKHMHVAGMETVLGLSSLTEKQKSEIKAIYDANKTQFNDLQKQMRDLKEAEWAKIKPILSAEQLAEVQTRRGHRHHGSGHGSHGAGPGTGRDTGDAPAATATPAPADGSKLDTFLDIQRHAK